jgi:outer membrane receptor protein involved in Fe transport
MSAAFDDRLQVSDIATLQYGFTMDSVTFLNHLNYFSPYARLSVQAGEGARVDLTYSSGNARPDLAGDVHNSDLQRDLSTLGLFPRVSLRGARPKVQRGEEYEIGYTRKSGSRSYSISAYHESITNAALSMYAPAGLFAEGDILPDLFSGNSIFNAGNLESYGYQASVTQNFGELFSATLVYGSMGALTVDRHELVSDNPDELRSMIRAGRKHAATLRVAATVPGSGTHMIASYQFTADHQWAMPGNMYSTQSIRPIPGLNVYIRQPLPRLPILPWRMEATADLRNLLAEGYLPLTMADGQQAVLVQTPRSVRGGLSFIF